MKRKLQALGCTLREIRHGWQIRRPFEGKILVSALGTQHGRYVRDIDVRKVLRQLRIDPETWENA